MSRIDTQIQKKVCLLGDFSVGKTSLVERFVYDRFDDRYLSTIGVKISRKSVEVGNNTYVHLLLWDLAGGEEFTEAQTSYLRGAAGALIVCDLTRIHTLQTTEENAQQLRAIQPQAKIILVANKSDLIGQREIDQAALEARAEDLKASLFITSAKTGEQVEAAFQALASRLASSLK